MSDKSYDLGKAYDKNLTAKARLHYLENERHISDSPARMHGKKHGGPKMGAKKGDQSKSRPDYAMDSGNTDKGYRGKTGSSEGDQSATKKDYEKPVAAMHGKTHGGAKMYDKGPNMESAAQEKSDLMKMPGGYKVMGDNGPKMYKDSPMQMKGSWMSKHTKSRM